MTRSTIRIATRASKLALWQAEYIKSLIEASQGDFSVQIVHVKTVGDKNQTDALREFGGTGVFTREVQTSVLASETDIAVHSLKDLQTEPTEGLSLAGIPDRAPTGDALLLPNGQTIDSIDALPEGSRIGTGSPRRQAQLLHARPDLEMHEIRGNVDTRIRKLDDGEFDAIILAEAGLRRLGLDQRISVILEPPLMYPAVGQGALGLECRSDDERCIGVLDGLSNSDAASCVTAERALLSTLRAGCHAPLGVATSLNESELSLTAVLLSADGRQRLETSENGSVSQAQEIGKAAAMALLAAGGDKLVEPS